MSSKRSALLWRCLDGLRLRDVEAVPLGGPPTVVVENEALRLYRLPSPDVLLPIPPVPVAFGVTGFGAYFNGYLLVFLNGGAFVFKVPESVPPLAERFSNGGSFVPLPAACC